MKFFNATVAIAIAAALPSTTSATLRGEERKLQDEVGSMPIDAIEPVEPMHGGGHGSGYGGGGYGGYFNKIFDATCELAAELVDERLEKACDNASDFLMESCPGHDNSRSTRDSSSWDHDGHDDCCETRRRLDGHMTHEDCCAGRRRLEVHEGHDDCCETPITRRLGSHGGHGGHGGEPLCEPLCQEVGDFFGSYCVRHGGGHGGGWGHDGHGDRKVRKLKDTSSLMLQIDEVRKLQGSTEATPAIMEAVESFGALAVLGPDKFSDFKCEEAADIVDGRLEKACDNAEALLEFCPRRCHCGGMGRRQLSGHGGHDECAQVCKRRLGGHGGGGHGRGGDASVTLELCFELCDEVDEFFDSYCWDIHGGVW